MSARVVVEGKEALAACVCSVHGSWEVSPACMSGALEFNDVGLGLSMGGPSCLTEFSISLFFKVDCGNGSPRLHLAGSVRSETLVLSVAMVALLDGLPWSGRSG